MKSHISVNSIEIPLVSLIQVSELLVTEYSPDVASSVYVRLEQSGDELHVYTRLEKENSFESRGFCNDDSTSYS